MARHRLEPIVPAGDVGAPSRVPVAADFDKAWALAKAADITVDIRTTENRLADGDWYSASSSLRLLRDSFGRFADAGVPPGLDPANYLARLSTLRPFASMASREITRYHLEGQARFAVIKKETAVVFHQFNNATGANLQVP